MQIVLAARAFLMSYPVVMIAWLVPTVLSGNSAVATGVSTLFGVDRAFWSTQSTLLVYLSAEEADPSSELCPLLERYPELAASRVQLQPPPGSQKSVRFKQCRSY